MNWFLDSPQFKQGMAVEDFLDSYFQGQGFTVIKMAPRHERKLHLGDRIFIQNGQPWFVEYKSGIQTFYTGNIFLETVSVDSDNRKKGWVYTSEADFIIYATLLNGKILVLKPDRLRSKIESLKTMFRETKTGKNQNQGYDTHGVIVPLKYAEEHLAEKVLEIIPRV